MALTFCYDRLASDRSGYPNLAALQAEPGTPAWQTFDHHWPRTVPLRLHLYLAQWGFPCVTVPVDLVSGPAWYPIAFGWFDFSCDYLSMIPQDTMELVHRGTVKILFYYHEGDNPQRIKDRLDQLCSDYEIPEQSYIFVSANTAAKHIPGCVYFQDHECFFRYRNRYQQANPVSTFPTYEFLALNRTHKWWRATVMTDLLRNGVLDRSLWSYNTEMTTGEHFDDNPIEIDSIPDLRHDLHAFIENGPVYVDGSDDIAHNDHSRVNTNLFFATHWSIVLETHFDADQSRGTFLTEKTFKAIKYGHPFVIVGPAGSLAQLRADGYRVFDQVIDNSYDEIEDNTERWNAVRRTIMQIQRQGAAELARLCQADVQHNRDLFSTRGPAQLNTLIKSLAK